MLFQTRAFAKVQRLAKLIVEFRLNIAPSLQY